MLNSALRKELVDNLTQNIHTEVRIKQEIEIVKADLNRIFKRYKKGSYTIEQAAQEDRLKRLELELSSVQRTVRKLKRRLHTFQEIEPERLGRVRLAYIVELNEPLEEVPSTSSETKPKQEGSRWMNRRARL